MSRSIRYRFLKCNPVSHLQIELLNRYHPGNTDDDLVTGIHLSINGLAAGLRNGD